MRHIATAAETGATELRLMGLGLTALPEAVGQLTELKTLDLGGNQLIALPEAIGQLTQLQGLDLSHNRLTALPEAIGQLTQLQYLNVYENQLTALPEAIGRLTQLQSLTISDNRLTALPDAIEQLTQLRSLYLARLQLSTLPEVTWRLPKLRGLYVGLNNLTELPDAIGRLTQLEYLDLGANRLTALPDAIGQLTRLRHLDLGNNDLIALPDAIGLLTELESLDLADRCPVRVAEDVWILGGHERDGSKRLAALPGSVRRLSQLRRLYLDGNPDLGLPTELLGPDSHAVEHGNATPADPATILDYYFRTRGEARPLNEARLILVGFGGVGKTSLVNRLVQDAFIPGEAKTEGIAIGQWPIRLNSTEDIRLHVWDFGGQEIMHATHRFFMSQRSVYLLVLNGRGGRQQADAAYWLNLIATYAPDSPVIIVRNKIREDPCPLDRTALRRDFPAIRDVIDTDCADRSGIDTLAAAIRRETDALPEPRSRFPAAWFAIKDRLSAMSQNYISFDDYRAICASNGETDRIAQETLAFALNCLGIALNYRDDPRLHDTNVLNPHWVTEGVYGILNHPALTAAQAELRVADLRTMLDPGQFPPERHDFLLQLMRRFELAVPFPEQPDLYLVPERLSPEQPADVGEFDAAHCLNFNYDYPTLLPEGLLPRFIVRTHILSTGNPRWRSGVVLRLERNRALVLGDAVNRRVSIRIDGPLAGRRRLLAVIRYDLEHIHRNYKFQPQPNVPVPGHPNVSVPYGDLLTFERDSVPSIPVVIEGRTRMLEVRQLLDGVDLAPPPPADATVRRDTQPVTAFISYAHKDEALREELDTHLKLLRVTGELDAWHDRSIAPGEKWEGRINDNLQRADLVLLLLSPDFIASDYCRKEMEIALQREAAGQAVMVPIIARPCGWRHLKMRANQALPKDGKPVADAGHEQGHRDAAWVQVEDGIRRVLQALSRRFHA